MTQEQRLVVIEMLRAGAKALDEGGDVKAVVRSLTIALLMLKLNK